MTKYTTNLSVKVNIELLPGLKIDLNADRTYALNHQEYFRADSSGEFGHFSPKDAGSFSISYISWGTAFNTDYNKTTSSTFENMKADRSEIAARLSAQNPNSIGMVYDSVTQQEFPVGYGPTSQDVLIPSFVAAYTNQSVGKVPLDYFIKIPLPNWRITYDGLTKISFLSKIWKSATLSHAYRSVYAISNYGSNQYFGEENGEPAVLYPNSNSFYPQYDVAQITIVEQFAPLFGIDMTWNNSLLTRFEYKKSRNLTFSMANKQLTDVAGDEIVVGLGYRIKDVAFTVSSIGGGGRKTNLKSDIDIKLDFSVRNNRTVLRRVDQPLDQVSAGQQVVSVNTTIDYALSKSLTLRLYFGGPFRSCAKRYRANQPTLF